MNTTEQIPPLAPPHPVVPAGFWELHGPLIVLLGILALVSLGVLVWLLLRRKPASPIPAAVQARHALESLRDEPETGAVLSRVSQVLRRYFTDAFSLGAGEMTTAELSLALGNSPSAPPELSGSVAGFLRACDERKFRQNAASTPLEAVPAALQLIEQAETRRAEAGPQTETAASEANPARA